MNDARYVPAHHPLCSCELCMLHERTKDLGHGAEAAVRRQAVAFMNRHGRPMRPPERADQSQPFANAIGKTVQFQWYARQPDLRTLASPWNPATEATVLAVGNGALLLETRFAPRPRWWPLRSFAWIEVVEVLED
jgi:hypothetical protein